MYVHVHVEDVMVVRGVIVLCGITDAPHSPHGLSSLQTTLHSWH